MVSAKEVTFRYAALKASIINDTNVLKVCKGILDGSTTQSVIHNRNKFFTFIKA
jgi:hypothetical protein